MTIHTSVGYALSLNEGGHGQLVYRSAPIIAESLATSGTAASTTTLAAATRELASGNMFVRIASVDANHYVRVAGTVSATNGYYVPVGTWVDLAFVPGNEVSAITV